MPLPSSPPLSTARFAAAWLLLAAAAAVAPVCAADSAGVRIESAWIRWLPSNLPAGAYLVVINDGATPVRLLRATSPDYGAVSLHRSVDSNGTTHMAPIDHLDIAPHSRLDFAATGYHLMLTQAKVTVKPGDHVPVTLQFQGSAPMTASFEVRAPASGAPGPGMPGMADMPGMSGSGH